jgi:hypothetical protein
MRSDGEAVVSGTWAGRVLKERLLDCDGRTVVDRRTTIF